MRKKVLHHPILDIVEKYSKNTTLFDNYENTTEDPQEFLEWWWETKGKGCTECALFENRNSIVKPDGKAHAKIMIVGESPGFSEDLCSIPLVGNLEILSSRCNQCTNFKNCFDGRLLNRLDGWMKKRKHVTCNPNLVNIPQVKDNFFMKSAGSILDGIILNKWGLRFPRQNWIDYYSRFNMELPDSPWYITNTIMCRPAKPDDLTKDTEPSNLSKKICAKHLAYQIAAIQPKVIITLGQHAKEVICGNGEESKRHSNGVFYSTKYCDKVISDLHPAYFMREKNPKLKGFGFAKLELVLINALKEAQLI